MYDEIVKKVELTSDEVDLIYELLEEHLLECISVSEEMTVQELMDKLK